MEMSCDSVLFPYFVIRQTKRFSCIEYQQLTEIRRKRIYLDVNCTYSSKIVERAIEKLELYFGGGTFASFDASQSVQAPLRTRLEWCLDHVKEIMAVEERNDWIWILKPSVTNKGTNICLIRNWEELLDTLEYESD